MTNMASLNKQDLTSYIESVLKDYSSGKGRDYRSDWQYLISRVAERYHLNAGETAHLIYPIYDRIMGIRSKRYEYPESFKQRVEDIPYIGYGSHLFDRDYTKHDISGFVREYLKRNRDWRGLVSAVSREFDLSAAEAAHVASPIYEEVINGYDSVHNDRYY